MSFSLRGNIRVASVSLVISTNRHNQTVTQECMSDRIDPSYAGCPDIRRLSRWIIHENHQLGIRGFAMRK